MIALLKALGIGSLGHALWEGIEKLWSVITNHKDTHDAIAKALSSATEIFNDKFLFREKTAEMWAFVHDRIAELDQRAADNILKGQVDRVNCKKKGYTVHGKVANYMPYDEHLYNKALTVLFSSLAQAEEERRENVFLELGMMNDEDRDAFIEGMLDDRAIQFIDLILLKVDTALKNTAEWHKKFNVWLQGRRGVIVTPVIPPTIPQHPIANIGGWSYEIEKIAETMKIWWDTITHWMQRFCLFAVSGCIIVALCSWLFPISVTYFVVLIILLVILCLALYAIDIGVIIAMFKTPYVKKIIAYFFAALGIELVPVIYFYVAGPYINQNSHFVWIIMTTLLVITLFIIFLGLYNTGKESGKWIKAIRMALVIFIIGAASYPFWNPLLNLFHTRDVVHIEHIKQEPPPQCDITQKNDFDVWYDVDTIWTRIDLPSNTHREYYHTGTIVFRFANGKQFEADADGACFPLVNGVRGERLPNDQMGINPASWINIRAKHELVKLRVEAIPLS